MKATKSAKTQECQETSLAGRRDSIRLLDIFASLAQSHHIRTLKSLMEAYGEGGTALSLRPQSTSSNHTVSYIMYHMVDALNSESQTRKLLSPQPTLCMIA